MDVTVTENMDWREDNHFSTLGNEWYGILHYSKQPVASMKNWLTFWKLLVGRRLLTMSQCGNVTNTKNKTMSKSVINCLGSRRK